MRTFGDDRCRPAGDRLILLSAIPKGWNARVAKTNTSAEYPGTAVLWDEQYFEVIEAVSAGGDRVRYVLAPWREEHTMRNFEAYDEESEARRREDFELARKQRRASGVARGSSVLLGHLPWPAQEQMQNELGVAPVRMTILSAIPPMVLFGICIFLTADATLRQTRSVVPLPLLIVTGYLMAESLFRISIALSHGRGIGSLIGTIAYSIYRLASPNRDRLAPPFATHREKIFTLPPSEDVALRDSLTMRGPLLTLLSRREQEQLAVRYGFDYRQHAFTITWIILVGATIGAVSAVARVKAGAGVSTMVSMLVAGAIALEQIVRLMRLQRGPAPSVLGALARPFVRDLLT